MTYNIASWRHLAPLGETLYFHISDVIFVWIFVFIYIESIVADSMLLDIAGTDALPLRCIATQDASLWALSSRTDRMPAGSACYTKYCTQEAPDDGGAPWERSALWERRYGLSHTHTRTCTYTLTHVHNTPIHSSVHSHTYTYTTTQTHLNTYTVLLISSKYHIGQWVKIYIYIYMCVCVLSVYLSQNSRRFRELQEMRLRHVFVNRI